MTDPRDIQGGAGNTGPGDSPESSSVNGASQEGAERPRRSKKAKEDSPEVPSGWRSSRRGSKTAQRARKEMKSRETKERMAEGARDTGRKITDGATTLGKGIAGVALGLLIVVLLFTAINGIARWNAKRLDDLENSPEALLEQARDNLLFIAEEEGRAVGFLALKVEGDREQIYGIAIPDAAFVEVPGRGFQRIGESYEAGPDVSLSAVSNFFTVPFTTYAIVPPEVYQAALTEQSVTGLLAGATGTNLSEEDVERWTTIFETVKPENVALLPMPVKPINVGSQTYFEPQREEVSDLLEQWWGVTIGGDEGVVRVIVYNGSGEPGVAGAVAQQLIGAGYRVVDTKNADSFDYAETQVIVQTDDPTIGDVVVEALGAGVVTVQSVDQDVAEVIIIVGKDYEPPE